MSRVYLTSNFLKQYEDYITLENKKKQKKSKAAGQRINSNVIDDEAFLHDDLLDVLRELKEYVSLNPEKMGTWEELDEYGNVIDSSTSKITTPCCTYCGSTQFTENSTLTSTIYDFYINKGSSGDTMHFCTCSECHRAFSYKG